MIKVDQELTKSVNPHLYPITGLLLLSRMMSKNDIINS
jgi:hypothetical protein